MADLSGSNIENSLWLAKHSEPMMSIDQCHEKSE